MAKKKIVSFEDMEVWNAAMEIVVDIYQISDKGKLAKEFYVRDQIRDAALSISSNIAEGFEYDNRPDFLRFLRYAKGSCGECRNQLIFLKKVSLITEEEFSKSFDKSKSVSKQLKGFIQYLKNYKPTENKNQ